MEPAAAVWIPCNLQLANYSTTEPGLCAPFQPIEYVSTQVYDSCHQISLPICELEQHCEYEVATQYNKTTRQRSAAADANDDMERMMEYYRQNPISAFSDVAEKCNEDARMARKMHRYPASIRALRLDERYTEPILVAIGPYYHGRKHLEQAEKMKHVAAYQSIKDSGKSPEEMYDAIVQVAHGVRSLYDGKDMEAAGIGYDDFLHIMFFDACFLVQYMRLMSDYKGIVEMEESLSSFLDNNDNEIFHDIMLLENQIPWPVVEKLVNICQVPLETFIYSVKDCVQDRKCKEDAAFVMDHSEPPAHLLGLLRYYIVGRNRNNKSKAEPLNVDEEDEISLSISANELAEIGIKLRANENTGLIHMGVQMKCIFGDLFLAPLSLDDKRASCLISMAALELCTTSNFAEAEDEDSAVCSYLLLLAMLVAREEDVQKLRTKHVLQGAGLGNKEVLELLTKLQGLRLGSCYVRTMKQIESYKSKRRTRTRLYAPLYRNRKLLTIVIPIILTFVSILVSIFKPGGVP